MGAWGTGMLENDDAQDALSDFIFRTPLKRNWTKVFKQLAENPDNDLQILGISSALLVLESAILRRKEIRPWILSALDRELKDTDGWRNPEKRRSALRRFREKLLNLWSGE